MPDTSWAWVGLAADVVSVAVPFATGGGAIVKVASKADDVIDLGRTVDKALDVADTAADIGKAADRIDDVNDSSRAVKNICERACFIAGTLIETDNGSVPIEEITAGMLVYAHNPDTGETELKEVVQTFVRETNELVHIKVNGEEIISTPTHPFWVPQKGWTDAIQLRAGDRLQLLNGEYVIIEQVQHEILEAPVTVYNFEVEDFHTYYVSDSAVLVHNKCGEFNDDQKALIELAKESRKGVTRSEANILVDWAEEYGLNSHRPMMHVNKSGIWSEIEHIKIFKYHIPIIGE